jgi:hypothetical protein
MPVRRVVAEELSAPRQTRAMAAQARQSQLSAIRWCVLMTRVDQGRLAGGAAVRCAWMDGDLTARFRHSRLE